MTPARIAALVRTLAGVDWQGLAAHPAPTLAAIAEAILPVLGPAGFVAADGVALFLALADLALVRPGASGEGRTRDTPHSGRRA